MQFSLIENKIEHIHITHIYTYIDCNNIGRFGYLFNRSIGNKMASVITALLKHEEHFFLSNFCEVELFIIEGLKNLVQTEFSWSFLQDSLFVELCNESMMPRNELFLGFGQIIPENPLLHFIFPLSKQQIMEEWHFRNILRCVLFHSLRF